VEDSSLYRKCLKVGQSAARGFFICGDRRSSPTHPPTGSGLPFPITAGSNEQELGEVPRVQKKAIAEPLFYYRDNHLDKIEAIVMAYRSGDFTLEEVGAFLGKGRSTISQKVRACERDGKWVTFWHFRR
jgi:hypothetical protein